MSTRLIYLLKDGGSIVDVPDVDPDHGVVALHTVASLQNRMIMRNCKMVK